MALLGFTWSSGTWFTKDPYSHVTPFGTTGLETKEDGGEGVRVLLTEIDSHVHHGGHCYVIILPITLLCITNVRYPIYFVEENTVFSQVFSP